VLVLGVVLAEPFGRGEQEPVPDVGDDLRPLLVRFGLALPSSETLDEALDLQELLLGVLVVRLRDTALSVQARRSDWKSLISAFGVRRGSSLM